MKIIVQYNSFCVVCISAFHTSSIVWLLSPFIARTKSSLLYYCVFHYKLFWRQFRSVDKGLSD